MKKFIFILLSCISLNIHAVNPTQGPLQQHPALCQYGYNPNCGQNTPPPPQKIIRYIEVEVPSKYGALASNNKLGAVGGAINMNSLDEAKREAIKRCENNGKYAPCKVVTWVRNGCFAGAANSKNKLYRAVGEPGSAEQIAMSYCKASGVSGCEIVIPEACSVP